MKLFYVRSKASGCPASSTAQNQNLKKQEKRIKTKKTNLFRRKAQIVFVACTETNYGVRCRKSSTFRRAFLIEQLQQIMWTQAFSATSQHLRYTGILLRLRRSGKNAFVSLRAVAAAAAVAERQSTVLDRMPSRATAHEKLTLLISLLASEKNLVI